MIQVLSCINQCTNAGEEERRMNNLHLPWRDVFCLAYAAKRESFPVCTNKGQKNPTCLID